MYKVTKELYFCYGHRLMQYDGKCRVPHGHNAKVAIDLEADTLDPVGMVVDFTAIKRVIQEWIDSTLDHRMLLRKDDPLAKWLQEMGEPCFLMDQNPTAEALAQIIFTYAAAQGFSVVEVRLWETPDAYATYRPHEAAGQGTTRLAGAERQAGRHHEHR
jgi:6-pyruvoyltetrahydropterin/6-carboxytetrahydropterin synthase